MDYNTGLFVRNYIGYTGMIRPVKNIKMYGGMMYPVRNDQWAVFLRKL